MTTPGPINLEPFAGSTVVHALYYRFAQGIWLPVTIGPGLNLIGSMLTTLKSVKGVGTAAETMASGATLDLSGTPSGSVIDVTGTTGITAITLADGEERLLRFTGAGLTLTPGASLLTPGGAPVHTDAGGFSYVRGGASGVVTVANYQTPADFKVDTFRNIFMDPGGNILWADSFSPYFDIGRSGDPLDPGGFLRIANGGDITILRHDLSAGAELGVNLLTINRHFEHPDHDGTYATQAGAESLTAKKLGDLTTNGVVLVNAADEGDGTLSVGPKVESGVYAPTFTDPDSGAVISSFTSYDVQYLRVGDTVTVSGEIDISIGTLTGDAIAALETDYPIATGVNEEGCAGTIVGLEAAGAAKQVIGRIRGKHHGLGGRFELVIPNLGDISYVCSYHYTYQIIM